MNQKHSFKKIIENGITLFPDKTSNKIRLEYNEKLVEKYNHNRIFHEFERVLIDNKEIFVCPKKLSYKIEKVVDGDKITYKIGY